MKTANGFIYCQLCNSPEKELNATLGLAICNHCLTKREIKKIIAPTSTSIGISKSISDLNEINELDITYLFLNQDLSFIDRSTLMMIQTKINAVIKDLTAIKD